MKRSIFVLLVIFMLLLLFACTAEPTVEQKPQEPTPLPAQLAEPELEPEPEPEPEDELEIVEFKNLLLSTNRDVSIEDNSLTITIEEGVSLVHMSALSIISNDAEMTNSLNHGMSIRLFDDIEDKTTTKIIRVRL